MYKYTDAFKYALALICRFIIMMNTYPMSNRRYHSKAKDYNRKQHQLIEQCPICYLPVEQIGTLLHLIKHWYHLMYFEIDNEVKSMHKAAAREDVDINILRFHWRVVVSKIFCCTPKKYI